MSQNEFPQTILEKEEWLSSRIEACHLASTKLKQLNASVTSIRKKINDYPSLAKTSAPDEIIYSTD